MALKLNRSYRPRFLARRSKNFIAVSNNRQSEFVIGNEARFAVQHPASPRKSHLKHSSQNRSYN